MIHLKNRGSSVNIPSINSKLPQTAETIFTTMSVMAVKHQAINLGQGFPDFEMSPRLISLVDKAMRDGHNQYAHKNGLPSLREKIAEKVFFLYQNKIDPGTEICITPGGTYAIYTALTTVLHPGDEVIVFEPAYDSYIPNILVNGAIPVLIALVFPEYKIDWNVVRERITPRTKMIILNSPHNPTGSVLNKEDIEQLKSIVLNSEILILSDEVYEHIIFDGKPHESILKYPELLARSFVCFSFGKVYNCTGWKMGYCIAPAAFMKEFLKVHQFNCFSCHTPVQYALSEFLEAKNEYLTLGSFLQKKRDYLSVMMKETKFQPFASHGSYFQLYSYADLSDANELEFAIRLTQDAGVAVIPVSAFYQTKKENQVLRFCFVKKESTLENAVERLIKYERSLA